MFYSCSYNKLVFSELLTRTLCWCNCVGSTLCFLCDIAFLLGEGVVVKCQWCGNVKGGKSNCSRSWRLLIFQNYM